MLLGLSVAGLLFSGYLSGVKLFSGVCAFNEGCPLFFGFPACYFGFAMFLVLTALAILGRRGKLTEETVLRDTLVVSCLGMLFAGYYTLLELPTLFREGLAAYMLGLPTCALGFIFYAIIFVHAFRRIKADA